MAAKRKVAKRTYVDSEGKEFTNPTPQCVGVKFTFAETGRKLVMRVDELSNEVLAQAALFGIKTAVGNAYGGVADDDIEDAAETRWLTMKEDGKWSSDRVVGPRTSDIAMAILEAKIRAGTIDDNEPAREAELEAIKAKAEADDEYLKGASKNAHVKAELERIKLKRAQERADKAEARAEDSDAELAGL